MFPNMKGETGIRNLPPVHIDESPSDIFENLQMGAMFYAEAQNDRWTFSTDTLYMNLGSDMSRNEPGLIEAVKDRNIEAVRSLLKERADVNARQGDGATALHWAVHRQDDSLVDLLLRAGAKPDLADDTGATPLYLACLNRSAATLEV